jgi:hypothetical protein
MKTTKLFLVFSLVLIFVLINSVYAKDGTGSNPQMTRQMNIRYEVNVILNSRIDLCNTYYIQVTDETGRLIAPRKIFDPGTQKYIFSENGPAKGKIRVAMMVLATDVDTYSCPVYINARPDVKIGPFLPGDTYSFVLRPFVKAPLDKD